MLSINLKTKQNNIDIPYDVVMHTNGTIDLIIDLNLFLNNNNVIKQMPTNVVSKTLSSTVTNTPTIVDDEIDVSFISLVPPDVFIYISSGNYRKNNKPEPAPDALRALKDLYDAKHKEEFESETSGRTCTACDEGKFIRKNIKPFLPYFMSEVLYTKVIDVFNFFKVDDRSQFKTDSIKIAFDSYQKELDAISPDACPDCIKSEIKQKYIDILRKICLI